MKAALLFRVISDNCHPQQGHKCKFGWWFLLLLEKAWLVVAVFFPFWKVWIMLDEVFKKKSAVYDLPFVFVEKEVVYHMIHFPMSSIVL